jgi:hypothetical protein
MLRAQGALAASAVQRPDLDRAVAGASEALARRIGDVKGAVVGLEARVEAVQQAAGGRDDVVFKADLKRKLERVRSAFDAALSKQQRDGAEALKAAVAGLQTKAAGRQLEERVEGVEAALQRGLRGVGEKAAAAIQLKADSSIVAELTRRLEAGLSLVHSRSAGAEAAAGAAAEAAASAEHAAERATAAAAAAGGTALTNTNSFWPLAFQPPPQPAAAEVPQTPATAEDTSRPTILQQRHHQPCSIAATVLVSAPEQQVVTGTSGQPTASSCAATKHLATGSARAAGTTLAAAPQQRGSATSRLRGASQNTKRAQEEARRQQQLRTLSVPILQRPAPEDGGLGALLLLSGRSSAADGAAATVADAGQSGGRGGATGLLSVTCAGALRTAGGGGELRMLERPAGRGGVILRYGGAPAAPSLPGPPVTRLGSPDPQCS